MPESPPLNPTDFTRQFEQAAQKAGFRVEPYGEIHGHPLVAFSKRTPGPRPRVYFSAGIHGDEPAPPLALLHLVTTDFFTPACNWFLCPLINPTGFLHSTRENHARADLNRDYKETAHSEIQAHVRWLQRQPNFDVVICLHEDWESRGFYLYELNPEKRPTLANVMIAAAQRHSSIETAAVIDGRERDEPGIIRPVSDPMLRETWPEAIYLRKFHSLLNYTTETPSARPLQERIDTHCAVIKAAITEFCRPAKLRVS